MSSANNKNSDGSNSTHSSVDSIERRGKVATSMRKILSEDDDFDYLGSLTSRSKAPSSRISAKSTGRKKVPTSYRRSKLAERENPANGSRHRRVTLPPAPRSQRPRSRERNKSKPKSKRTKNSNRSVYEGSLNDTKPRESAQSLMASARKLLDKAARAASPGRLRRDRSSSPGPHKTRNSIQSKNPGSPTSNNTAPLSSSPVSSPKRAPRPKSPGRLKKKESQDDSEEKQRSTRSKKRSESPGRLKKRSKSPGKLKKRSQSPGALKKNRPRRRPENGDERHRNNSNDSNGPMKKPVRARSHDRNAERRSNQDSTPAKPRSIGSTNNEGREGREGYEGDAPVKENSNQSNMQHEVNRYKVKRNKSMDAAMTHRARRANARDGSDDDDSRRAPRRAESMMLSREMGRRGKSNSLADLIQYREEEIHSTSYFASNHVLINRERMKRGLRPLTRNVPMDQLARKVAETMAESSGLEALPTTYVGNVLRGENIRAIHRSTMLQKQGRERANILNPYFQDFGVGTCKGKDGMLYMCQLFSERLEIRLTDTVNDEDSSE
eukprot:CAMPEP_0197184870 /NCGR_PEP_ID=MMETSP1423-20130617/10750_1 /TAXON_ID=476441 /ORGANISM="Pseudo-nitzschia heimii, Strain UNC1101" /LENGTH=551 /DNA_ID=CAMNT_0042635801 /DNA_START=327 /DNA_END=1982 /DNA_ORIENTATION=-